MGVNVTIGPPMSETNPDPDNPAATLRATIEADPHEAIRQHPERVRQYAEAAREAGYPERAEQVERLLAELVGAEA